jgi:Spy/CpxP family protein refolding chaperone
MGAGRGGMGGKAFRPMRIEAVAAQLGLSEAALAQIKDLAFAAEQEAIGIRAELQKEQLELRKLMDADVPDEAAVMRQIDEVMVQEARMRKNQVGLLLKVRKLMTPDQRAQLDRLMMQRRGRGPGGGGGMGMGQGQGMGPGMGPGMGGGMGKGKGRMGRGASRFY